MAAPAAPAAPREEPRAPPPRLVRALRTKDVALITIGSVLGSAIFIAAAEVPRAVPHPLLVVALWVAGGLLTLAGCLAYAELGGMYPRSGGPYQYLKEAYGPFPAFLYGWTSFLVILSGGIASLAVAFGEYLGAFAPFFSSRNVLAEVPLGAWAWRISGAQVAAAAAIAFLTAVNYIGLREGAGLQNAVTLLKVASLLALAGFGLLAPATASNAWMPAVSVAPAAMGVALIAVLWSYDGWYCATFSAGETVDAGRSLPRGLFWGIAALVVLYTATNVVYLRALSVPEMAASTRVGEAAAAALFGPTGGRLLALAVVLSTFGCLSSNILTCARVYQPMADDGLFFRGLAAIHPRHRTPAASLVAQGAWSCALAFTGTYEQLYTYTVFAGFLFHAATGLALFTLRRTQPATPRPYRAWGYPFVPALFVLVSAAFVLNTLRERPTESFWGLALIAFGLPAYFFWRRR